MMMLRQEYHLHMKPHKRYWNYLNNHGGVRGSGMLMKTETLIVRFVGVLALTISVLRAEQICGGEQK